MKRATEGQASVHIDAAPELVYDLVSDVTRMGEWSPAEPVKPIETSAHSFCMSASRDGSLIQATVGSLGGVGRRWRKRAGVAA